MLEEEGRAKVAEMDVASLQQKVATLEEECEDRNRMAKEWYDDLQVRRQPCQGWSLSRKHVVSDGKSHSSSTDAGVALTSHKIPRDGLQVYVGAVHI